MTVGIAGDADLADSVTLERAAVDHLDRAAELAGGLLVVAGDDQEALDARLAAEAGEEIVDGARAPQAAGRHARVLPKPRPARCGTGSKPALRSRAAASIASCAGRFGTALT